MGVINRPTEEILRMFSEDKRFDMEAFASDIIKGKYALLIGSEVILKEERSGGDSRKEIFKNLKDILKLGQTETNCNSFTELSAQIQQKDLTQRIVMSLLGSKRIYDSTDLNDVSDDLLALLRTRFFRVVITTTFDEYLETAMKEIWKDEGVRIMNLYGSGENFDYHQEELISGEFDMKPTLYYLCGKVNDKGEKFVVTENDAVDAIATLFSNRAPINFLKRLSTKGLISLGCKLDDWLFRFVWHVLRKDANNLDSTLKDTVAVSFSSDSDQKLKKYLENNKVKTFPNANAFIKEITEEINQCLTKKSPYSCDHDGVFISYAHEDFPIVSSIVNRLKKARFNIWFDNEKLICGDEYDTRIRDAINRCKIFMPILSHQVKSDLSAGQLDRYYIQTEWKSASLRLNIDGDNSGNSRLRIMPVAISGYDSREAYHQKFMFPNNSVSNLCNTPIETIIAQIKQILNPA